MRSIFHLGLLSVVMYSCGGASNARKTTEEKVDVAQCTSDAAFFKTEVQGRVLTPICSTCHTRSGLAHVSDFILENSARPDYLEINRSTLGDIAGLERDGTSIVLLKVQGMEDHGGGQVLSPTSDEFAILQDFVGRLDHPVDACPDEVPPVYGEGLVLLSPVDTLRKASLLLVGRLPTTVEESRVEAGGEDALREVLREQMVEEAFVERMKEVYNDLLLTDAFTSAYSGVTLLDYDRYPNRYWFEYEEPDLESSRRAATSEAIARAPLELLAHILRSDLPFTELLTADYVMVNDYSAMSYGVAGATSPDPADPAGYVFRPEKLDGVPHAGILTTTAFLNRYPTTETNRNRHRTWAFMKKFLATDLLQFADRPIDLTASDAHNPTLNDAQCNICHAVMDPVAGLFQNWDDSGALNPRENGWYPEMEAPGFEGEQLPADQVGSALAWMAARVAEDQRFAVSTTQTVLAGVTGLELLLPSAALGTEDEVAALEAQNQFVNDTAERFVQSGYDVKQVVEDVVLSRYFRSAGDAGASAGDLVLAGTAKLLTPEELDRKLLTTTGYEWSSWDGQYLTNRYRLLYGGIDSDGITNRLRDPNGIMGAIEQRMANQVACRAVPRDFSLPANQRRLFPMVEPTYLPVSPDGFAIPDAEEAIRANIAYLHAHLLGEYLGPNDAELEHTYQLWLDVMQTGRAAIENGEETSWLHWDCRATTWDGLTLPVERQVTDDEHYTVRAWSIVLNYLLTDYRFSHE